MKRDKDNYEQFDQLTKWMKVSNDLYNQALYIIKKNYEENKNSPGFKYLNLDKIMKQVENLDGEVNYYLMPKTECAQQTLRLLDRNIRSFYGSLKSYIQHPERWRGSPHFPKFRKKGSRFILIFTSQGTKIRNKKICIR